MSVVPCDASASKKADRIDVDREGDRRDGETEHRRERVELEGQFSAEAPIANPAPDPGADRIENRSSTGRSDQVEYRQHAHAECDRDCGERDCPDRAVRQLHPDEADQQTVYDRRDEGQNRNPSDQRSAEAVFPFNHGPLLSS